MWIVPTALVALGIALFLLFRVSNNGGGILDSDENTIPAFHFRLARALAIPVTDKKPTQFEVQAQDVAARVRDAMTTMYREAFLDPANWRAGSYDEVWPLFEERARATAQQDEPTLTLGSTAGDRYDEVNQPVGSLSVKVLLDRTNRPATAVAIVRFKTVAATKGGASVLVVSTGQFFLRPLPEGWRVYAFSVSRHDHEVVPSPGPSSSASAVPS